MDKTLKSTPAICYQGDYFVSTSHHLVASARMEPGVSFLSMHHYLELDADETTFFCGATVRQTSSAHGPHIFVVDTT
ncbi:hypothetical protein EG68_09061 [Paragonimus skrjabini miyazakii]|uniref:Uncharacterized protein n=1 Tax=Paragonimus skrjabini miyazakii TaxID=59628 RepID=A0A8S9YKM2_9TREM|nr:hypothetical protein EG68_09061 [Paragonimus skrjabini miyazakii]